MSRSGCCLCRHNWRPCAMRFYGLDFAAVTLFLRPRTEGQKPVCKWRLIATPRSRRPRTIRCGVCSRCFDDVRRVCVSSTGSSYLLAAGVIIVSLIAASSACVFLRAEACRLTIAARGGDRARVAARKPHSSDRAGAARHGEGRGDTDLLSDAGARIWNSIAAYRRAFSKTGRKGAGAANGRDRTRSSRRLRAERTELFASASTSLDETARKLAREIDLLGRASEQDDETVCVWPGACTLRHPPDRTRTAFISA